MAQRIRRGSRNRCVCRRETCSVQIQDWFWRLYVQFLQAISGIRRRPVTCQTRPLGLDNCASWTRFRSSRILRQVSWQACTMVRSSNRLSLDCTQPRARTVPSTPPFPLPAMLSGLASPLCEDASRTETHHHQGYEQDASLAPLRG